MGPEIYDKMHHMAYLSNALPGYAGRWFCCRCHFHSGLVNILGTFHRHARGIITDIVHEEGKRKFPLTHAAKEMWRNLCSGSGIGMTKGFESPTHTRAPNEIILVLDLEQELRMSAASTF